MRRLSRSGAAILALSLALVASLSYNYIWASTAPSVFELHCHSRYAEVLDDAIELDSNSEWAQAAHLYAYLIRYHPHSTTYCNPDSAEPNWLLPLGALAWTWKTQETAHQKSQTNAVELRALRDDYSHALGRASASGDVPELATSDPPEH